MQPILKNHGAGKCAHDLISLLEPETSELGKPSAGESARGMLGFLRKLTFSPTLCARFSFVVFPGLSFGAPAPNGLSTNSSLCASSCSRQLSPPRSARTKARTHRRSP